MVDELLTVKQVSAVIKTNGNYVRDLIKSGLIDYLKVGSMKVRTSTLNAFLEKWEGWDLSDPWNPKQMYEKKDAKEKIVIEEEQSEKAEYKE